MYPSFHAQMDVCFSLFVQMALDEPVSWLHKELVLNLGDFCKNTYSSSLFESMKTTKDTTVSQKPISQ